jgi:hypothetical protein
MIPKMLCQTNASDFMHTWHVLIGGLRRSMQFIWRRACKVLLRVLPARRHAVVHGWPDDEGNAIEVVRALRRRYRGKVYWLLSDIGYTGPLHAADDLADTSRIIRIHKNSVRSIVLALGAEATFFTHGLFTAVDPPRDRLVVNLWHGDGPKIAKDTDLIRSTVLVANTVLWGGKRARQHGLPAENLAVVGNPRVDQFTSVSRDKVLTRLGLDPDRRTILWLPTYRAATGPLGRSWRDGDNLSENASVAEIVNAIDSAVTDSALQVVLKPHPLDSDAYGGLSIQVLPHDRLREVGCTLYQLLGAADAIISDISSVWTDFLKLDRPIGFYVPDLEELTLRRGLNVENVASLLPGPRIRTAQDAHNFLKTVASDPSEIRPSRYPGFAEIGPALDDRVTDRLLDWLDDFQRARGQEALFTGRELPTNRLTETLVVPST